MFMMYHDVMEYENICKFIQDKQSGGELIVLNFVYERNCDKLIPATTFSYSLGIVTSGCGQYTIDGKAYNIKKGDLFCSFPSKEFHFKSIDGLEFLFISFTGTRASALKLRAGATPDNAVFYNKEALLPLWENAHKTSDSKNIDLIAEGVLLYTLGEICNTSEEKNIAKNDTDIILQVKKYIEQNLDDPTLCLKTISKKFLYNDKYISEKFIKTMRIGFTDYIRNLRIERAVALLESGSRNIGEVARLCGYTDQFYFSKVFKQVKGISPKKYSEKR